MKSTMQYLMLGLALAGVPLLAEADSSSGANLRRVDERSPDHQHLLNAQQQLTLVTIEHQGQQPILKLQRDDGIMLKVRGLQQTAPTFGLSDGSRIDVMQEAHGWSLLSGEQLLAFIPNQYGQDLLHRSG